MILPRRSILLNVEKVVHNLIVKQVACRCVCMHAWLSFMRKWIRTDVLCCVPDYRFPRLLGGKIERRRAVSDSLSLVRFEQLERRAGEVQSKLDEILFFALLKKM